MSVEHRIKRWLKPEILQMASYPVADASDMIKLDAMENPYPLPQSLQADFLEALQSTAINRYPDPNPEALTMALKRLLHLDEGLSLLFGNGSDEIIQIIIMALAQAGRVIMAPQPGFVMYRQISQALGLQFVGVPLHDDFSLDEAAMLQAIDEYQPAVIFLAYPNNPTGNLFDREVLDAIIRSTQGLVVIDEAYQIFAQDSFVARINDYDNLLVMRTLSKAGLAGLRFGFLVGPEPWLQQMDKIRLPYNINGLTQSAVQFVLQHYAVLEQQAEAICQDRAELLRQMQAMSAIEVAPSAANFLLFRCRTLPAEQVFVALLERRILIKKLHGSHPLLDNCLRVTVGSTEENRCFLSALQDILKKTF